MICAHCSALTVLDPCPHCGRSPWLDGRYELLEVLASGEEGTTFAARRRGDTDDEGSLEIFRARAGDDEVAAYRIREPAEEGEPDGEETPAEPDEPPPDEPPLGNLGDAVEAARDEDLEREARTRILKVAVAVLVALGIGFAATLASLLRPWTLFDDPDPPEDAALRTASTDPPPPPEPEPTPSPEGPLPPHEIDETTRVDVGPGGYPARSGESGAAVTIVVFSDFGCLYCGRLAEAMAEIDREYGDTVAVHFRDYPLDRHTFSKGAHIAARCAHEQGRFWAMHDLLFEHYREHEPEHLREYARDLGLDALTFRRCQTAHDPLAQVEADRRAGKDAGVEATPTYFINGVPYSGGRNADWIRRLVDAELALLEEDPLSPEPP